MQSVYLAAAIICEVAATLSLRVASTGRANWYVLSTGGYLASFVLLSLTLREGMGLGVVYGVWTAVGVALTAIASKVIFGEALTLVMSAGVVLIIGGVLLIEVGGNR